MEGVGAFSAIIYTVVCCRLFTLFLYNLILPSTFHEIKKTPLKSQPMSLFVRELHGPRWDRPWVPGGSIQRPSHVEPSLHRGQETLSDKLTVCDIACA